MMTANHIQRPTDRHATGMSCFAQGAPKLAVKVRPLSGRTTE
jgi:hypothetical protein